MANALLTVPLETSRVPISMWFLPLAIEKTLSVAIAKVVVLIPPPVDPGEAPIHISKMTNNSDGMAMAEKSTVLKPAVRGVTALKAAVVTLPTQVL